MKKGLPVFCLSALLVFCCSWGFLVHRTVNQLAIYELPGEILPFFYQHKEYLVSNAPRPDLRRNEDSTEATRHFIDLEIFENASTPSMPLYWNDAVKKYTKDSLLKYGYVPYQVVFTLEKLTNAFKRQKIDSILYYAADLGHYIGDANVPLHTTVNYDGQLTDQKGLHSLWESMIPEIEIGNYQLSSEHKASYLKNPAEAIWAAVRRSASLVPEMLEKEKEVSKQFTDDQKYRIQIRRGKESKSFTSAFAKAYAASLHNSINAQLLHSADQIADFWYTAWVDAGKPDMKPYLKDWSAEQDQQLRKELEAFHSNKLLENRLLLSKQAEPFSAN
ncbi:MAG: hypothetical protein KGO92_05265 [Bacteroidota bacterium]|nr:hypothetical protein [Bacteroidota bacterium]